MKQSKKNKVIAASLKRVEAQKESNVMKNEWTLYTKWANQR